MNDFLEAYLEWGNDHQILFWAAVVILTIGYFTLQTLLLSLCWASLCSVIRRITSERYGGEFGLMFSLSLILQIGGFILLTILSTICGVLYLVWQVVIGAMPFIKDLGVVVGTIAGILGLVAAVRGLLNRK